MEKLLFFEFLRWPPPPSWIFEIAKFYWLLGWRGSRRISMPNFVKIGQSVAKILRFIDFSRWRPPLSWIVEFAKFYWLTVFGEAIRIIVPNIVKLFFFLLRRYCNISNFQNGRRRHLGFIMKFYWLLGWRGSRRISVPNFVKIGQSMAKILIFFDFTRWWPPSFPPILIGFH